MRFKSVNFGAFGYFTAILSIILSSGLTTSQSHAFAATVDRQQSKSRVDLKQVNTDLKFNSLDSEKVILSKLPILPETTNLVKSFEGFRSYAYIDSSGLPVIGYGQTRVNGRTVRMGQFIDRSQADRALEQELSHIQRLVLARVKVDLNPYQLGALTSLVYNAGTVVITNSTLARKLNAGDYTGASREFVRWNKANRGGKLVVFPGLTKRRQAEQKLFLTPYGELASNN